MTIENLYILVLQFKFFWIGKSVVYHSWSGKMGDMKRRSKLKKRGGWGERVVKTKEESGYCKE